MATLFIGSGPVTPAIVLAGLLVAVPLAGLGLRTLLGRTWIILLVAGSVGVFNVVLAPASSGATIVSGVAVGLRLLGIALSGVLALASTDPTDLADSLQQQARLSPRLAVGVLAAVRVLPILANEWQLLRMARRARGVSAGSPVAAARLTFGMLLALLVGAVRRATRLAMAMDARGFATSSCRTISRRQRVRAADWALLLVAATLGLGALGIGSSMEGWFGR